MRNIKFIVYTILLISLFSCSTIKEIKPEVKTEVKLAPISRTKLVKLIRDSSLKFESIKLKKLSIKINDNGKINKYKGSMRVIKDSSIWISLNAALGIEAVRLVLTKDSVYFLDRYHKEYYKGGYEFLEDKVGVDLNYTIIQSLLFNNLINYEAQTANTKIKKFNSTINDGQYVLKSMRERKLNRKIKQAERRLNKHKLFSVIYQENFINPETFRVNKINIKEIYRNWLIDVSYSHFSRNKNKLFPKQVLFDYKSLSSKISVKMNYYGLSFTNKIGLPFRIPSNYESIK